MSSLGSCLERGDVCAYVANAGEFSGDDTRLARALGHMTAAERDRYGRFRHDRDRWMFALGRDMARTLVGSVLGVAPDAWIWREGPHGRPEIARPDSDVHFNLSHSAGLVVCVVGRGRAVGVDIEDLARRAPDPAIVSRYCSESEAMDVRNQGDRWRDRFLTYWTLKEAYLKARGLGIAVPLSDISFTLAADDDTARVSFLNALSGADDRWAFHRMRLEPHHVAAVAIEIPDGASPRLTIVPY